MNASVSRVLTSIALLTSSACQHTPGAANLHSQSMTPEQAQAFLDQPPPDCMRELLKKAKAARERAVAETGQHDAAMGAAADPKSIDPKCWRKYTELEAEKSRVQEALDEYNAANTPEPSGPPQQ